MPKAYSTLMNATINGSPIYHPAYIHYDTKREVAQRLIFNLIVNDETGKSSYFNNFVVWGRSADVYVHYLYPGKYVTVQAQMSSQALPARYKNGGDIVYEHDGKPLEIQRVTYRVLSLEMGYHSSNGRKYLQRKAALEIQQGRRLPAWNLPNVRRTNGPSDYDSHKEWWKAYTREPFAAQEKWFGFALIEVWPGQYDIHPTGNRMDPPDPETNKKYGDYIVGDKVVPWQEYNDNARKVALHPITGEQVSPEGEEPPLRAMDGSMALKLPKGLLTFE